MSASVSPIKMPKLGLSMTEGSVAAWHIEPGTEVAVGDVIADIETSKIANELEAHVAGVFRRSVVELGVEVPVGALIGVVADANVSEDEIDEFIRNYSADPENTDTETSEKALMADSGPKKPVAGARTVNTERSTHVPESLRGSYDPDEVFATYHAHQLAQTLGADLAKVRGSGRGGRISRQDVEAAVFASGAARAAPSMREARSSGPSSSQRTVVKSTPAAERLAAEHDIDLSDVPATGTRGRVSKADVQQYLGRKGAGERERARDHEITDGAVIEEGLTAARRTIAKRLSESKRNAPHFRLSADIGIEALFDLRRQIEIADVSTRVSVNDMIIRAAGIALSRHPEVNIQFDGATVSRFPHADVAVAVAAEQGLVTPIVRNVDLKGLGSVARELRELVARARSGKLLPDEFDGGTFTVSNLGMFGVKSFDAIINPPQAAILAVGSAERRLYVDANDHPLVGTFITVTLSCDHRVIDGATGASFLKTLKEILQNPEQL